MSEQPVKEPPNSVEETKPKRFKIISVRPTTGFLGNLFVVKFIVLDSQLKRDIEVEITKKEFIDYLKNGNTHLLNLVIYKIREFDAELIFNTFDFSQGVGVEFD